MQTIHIGTEAGGILLLTFVGEILDNADVASLKSDLAEVIKKVNELHSSEGHVKTLIDITDFKAHIVGEAVEALIETAKQNKDIVDKTAVFGGGERLKIIGQTIVALSGRKNIEFFNTKDQALDWLNR